MKGACSQLAPLLQVLDLRERSTLKARETSTLKQQLVRDRAMAESIQIIIMGRIEQVCASLTLTS
jgi:hypothetical protein